MQIKIIRQEIGQIVGCSRKIIRRILKILENQNLICAHSKNYRLRHSLILYLYNTALW